MEIKIKVVQKDFKESDLRSIFEFWSYNWSCNRETIFIQKITR